MAYEDIISRLSLEQKCALLTGATPFGTRAIPSVGLPALQFADGPHGIRHQGDGANHLGIGESVPATCFPTAVTLAQTWDVGLVERVGAALGEEAAAAGVNVLLGPGVNIKRSPLCGRNFEYFSEDPYLAGKLAASYVRGVQSRGVGACVKHFAANSQETRRQASDSILDERTLREIYLTAFEIVVREARPRAIMSSYNRVNGTYANENARLLDEILRGEWGFGGAVVTDWGGSNDHVAGVRAGSTFEMPACGLDSVRELVRAVRSGALDESCVDARVEEAIGLVLSTHDAVAASSGTFDADAHHALAREAAASGAVLLKNDARDDGSGRPMLPLSEGTRVALVGDFAKVPRYQGAGSSLVNCTRLDTLLGVVEASGLTCVGYEPGFPRAGGLDERMASAAVDLASAADVTLCCLGLSEAAESEGLDRPNMALDKGQVALLERLAAANDNVVVLLFAGGAVETAWSRHARAVLYLGLGGQAGASAALDVVTGRVNPAGRLAETWPRALSDVPCAGAFPADGPTAEYREAIYVGYRYYQTAHVPVAYPFGHGLSYTRFAYSDLDVERNGAAVSFTLANVGPRAGAEVAQVYVSKPDARVFLPERELKGFARLTLAAGESRRVRVPLDDKAFRYFNVRTSAWEVEGGTYVVSVGGSSEDLPLSARVAVRGTLAPDPYGGEELPSYRSGSVRDVGPKEFATLLRRPLPRPGVALDRNLCLRDVGRGRSPIFWAVGAVLRRAATRLDADGRPSLGALFIYNMPIRAIAKNAGEFVSMGLVDAIVREIRGWGLAGVAVAVVFRIVLGWSAPLVWFLWFALPLAWEFALNLVLNAVGRARLGRESAARTPRGHTPDARTSRGQEAETKK